MTAYGTEFFSMNDVNRLKILQDAIERNLRPGQAAEMLSITPRHCSHLLKRYRQTGVGPVRHWSMSTMPPVV